jgi:hypothetical protein
MTFGQVKSIIEKSLLESYKNETEFKRSIKEFKHNVLTDKSISKLYSIYDQLSIPQGLSESEAREFLEEGISLAKYVLQKITLPKSISENIINDYEDIDTLVYTTKTDLNERVESKKNILKVLTTKKDIKEHVNLPIKSMVKIANQTISNYVDNLDESAKRELISILSEDTERLKLKFELIKDNAITKLYNILENENDGETKNKLTETIEKIKTEEFNQINYLRIKTLEQSI